ncbi:hypothetical protein MML48_2g00003613 [Holotrichia oblita]|uniref:Uncharacterized protein n=1 Tax=Holotrichia oblita TaxID=644536 RepID=A0ACB9TQL2_HOLOL|nr:hypothetical protein MML48_2g00003613 [Holotrichia oblita]
MDQDILKEIPFEDLQLLSKLYKNHETEAPHVYSLINTQISWRRKKPELQEMTFWGVQNNWLRTGTFIFLNEDSCYDLFVFTLEESCETLKEALIRTKRIDWTRKLIQWFAVSNKHVPTVLEVIKELKLPLHHCTETRLWAIEREKALEFQFKYPNDIYVKQLSKSDVSVINNNWPHKYEGSENYLSRFIEMNTCYGIFLKSDDKLVCWVLKNHLGQLGILQTLPEYKRKGYASLITKVMSKDIAKDGHNPLGTVLISNNASESMFEKLGFHYIDKCTYIECFE